MTNETCGVCWTSHSCHLPARHDGDHVEPARHINAVLDHAMNVHPRRWAVKYAPYFTDYLGNGEWYRGVWSHNPTTEGTDWRP